MIRRRTLRLGGPLAIVTLLVLGVGSPAALAQQREVAEAIHDATVAAQAVAEQPASAPDDFHTFVDRQANLEVQLGLRLYEEFDDFRAVTAFRRYQLLQPDSKRVQFLSALMIGQIYHRNDKPELAALSFERAASNAERPYDQTFAYLMGLQELCLPLSYYVQCRHRLSELTRAALEPEVRELVEYQLMYTDLVLRLDSVTAQRADSFASEALRAKARGLVERDQAFRKLPLKRPWLSGTLSAVLPGAGQLYNGRPVDGLLALLVNGAFGVGTYFAFAEAKSIPLGVVLSVLTAGFYTGNIINAVVDAKKTNARRYLDFFDQLKTDFWPRVAFVIDENGVLFTYGFDWPGPTLENRPVEPSDATTDRGQPKD